MLDPKQSTPVPLPLQPPPLSSLPNLSTAIPSLEPIKETLGWNAPPLMAVDDIRSLMGFGGQQSGRQVRKPCFAWQREGRCASGSACTYSHDVTAGVVRTVSSAGTGRSSNPCHAWQRGQCFRGDACRYSHGGQQQQQQQQRSNNSRSSSSSSAGRPPNPCFSWQRGECYRGDACRYNHDGPGGGSVGGKGGSGPQLISPGCLDDPWRNTPGRTMVEAQQYHTSLMPMLMSGGGNKRGRDGGRGRGGHGRGRWQRRPQMR